jgi:hypothetical protein
MNNDDKMPPDKLPTPMEIIEKVLEDLKTIELRESEKEHLTEVASNLTDFLTAVKARLTKDAS